MIPIDVVERWLEQKHCTLWADFDIDDAKGRRAAAEWFRHEIDSFEHFWIVPFIEEARVPRKLLSEREWPHFPPKEENRDPFWGRHSRHVFLSIADCHK